MIEKTIKEFSKFYELHKPFSNILEVGSRQVGDNIYSIADFFRNHPGYIGIDLEAGNNVTMVMDGHDIKQNFKEHFFDLTICCDTLEHDNKFWVTVDNMRWVTKIGGWMFIAVPGGACGLHEWPHDYWRFMKSGVIEFFQDFQNVIVVTWDIKANLINVSTGVQDLLGEIIAYGQKT